MSTNLQGYMDYVQRDELLNDGFLGHRTLFITYTVNTKSRELPDDLEEDIYVITRKISALFGEYCRKKFKHPEAAEEYYHEAEAKLALLNNFRQENQYPDKTDLNRNEKLKQLIQKFMGEVYGKL